MLKKEHFEKIPDGAVFINSARAALYEEKALIEELKKKEKEEQDRLAEQNAQNVIAQNGGNAGNTGNANRQNQRPGNKSSVWYFYNQMAVNQGKAEFQKIWGKRENVDNWQRVNKTVVAFDTPQEMTEEQLDSIARAEALADSLEQVADSAQNDPHKREYYLKQIPFTEEQVQASNLIIMDGLYNSGVIFKDKLDNLPLSEKALRRITDSYPEYENMADVFYHLFLLYSRMGDPQTVCRRWRRTLRYPRHASRSGRTATSSYS